MGAITLDVPKPYRDGSDLTEAMLDSMMSSIETWAAATVNNLNQMRLDVLGSSYTYDNDGATNNTYPFTQQLTITPSANVKGLILVGTNVTTDSLISVTGNALTSGSCISVSSSSSDATDRALIDVTNTSTTSGRGIRITQSASADCITLTTSAATGTGIVCNTNANSATSAVLYNTTTSLTTGKAYQLTANSLTTGYGYYISANAATTGFGYYLISTSTGGQYKSFGCDIQGSRGTGLSVATSATDPAIQVDTASSGAMNAILVNTQRTGGQGLGLKISSTAAIAAGANLLNVLSSATAGGTLVRFENTSSSTSTGNLVEIQNTNTAAVGCVGLYIAEASAGSTSNGLILLEASNASYANTMHRLRTTRTSSSAFQFIGASSNAGADDEFRVRGDGEVYGDGAAYNTPADYAEMFETSSGNAIEPGHFVTLNSDDGLISIASSSSSYILGIVSANPAVLGDASWGRWSKKYLTDEFGKKLYDSNGDRLLNPDYDSSSSYTPRSERDEWVAVGLLGKLYVRTSEDITGDFVDVDNDGHAKNGTTYKVIEKTRQKSNDPDNKGYGVVRILFK